MNGIDRIIKRIEDDCAAETDEIINKARNDAEAVITNARKEAEDEIRVIVERGRVQADERIVRLGGVAELEARKMRLAARQEMVERAFEMAHEKLCGMEKDKMSAFLVSLAVRYSGGESSELVFSKADREKIGGRVVEDANRLLSERKSGGILALSGETREIDGGFILKDGSVEMNCTFGAIVRMMRETLALEIAEILFQ